jgi:hypothetical protein
MKEQIHLKGLLLRGEHLWVRYAYIEMPRFRNPPSKPSVVQGDLANTGTGSRCWHHPRDVGLTSMQNSRLWGHGGASTGFQSKKIGGQATCSRVGISASNIQKGKCIKL